ncbi:hypothetical protein Y032_0522g2884 [Ancylostoma ceylanicum]|nr:hypothetical protein Y032_0522g2884 [Ancylostoma ceylanicum]
MRILVNSRWTAHDVDVQTPLLIYVNTDFIQFFMSLYEGNSIATSPRRRRSRSVKSSSHTMITFIPSPTDAGYRRR